MSGNRFFDMAEDNCPSCGAVPAIMWRPGGSFQQRTECICGRATRWVVCGHDARANATDDEVPVEDI
jgi:hypothetical protein